MYISFLVSLLLLIVIDISSYDNLVYGSDGGDGDGNDKREKAKHDEGDGDGNDKRENSLEELFENDDENDDENDIPFILPFNAVPFP